MGGRARTLAALACSAGSLALPAGASAGAQVPTLDWQDCGDGVQCATARVPLDYDRPDGRRISLAVARRPAPDPSRRIGSVFLNPGGPGGSGVAEVRGFQAGGPTNQRFDVVGFDPRGVAGSRPQIQCVGDRQFDREIARVPAALPSNLPRFLAAGKRFARGCLRRTPRFFLRHVTTADTARDMDLLRQAVGDEKLTYVGKSYGSEIGAVYASLFPERVRALVLDGGVNHRQWVNDPLGFATEYARGNEASLRQFFRFCETDPDSCPFADGDPRDSFDALIRSFDRNPVPGSAEDPRRLNGPIALSAALAAMYDTAAWGPLGVGLAQARDGNPAILKFISDQLTGRDDQGRYDNFLEAGAVVTASDSRSPRRRRAYARHLRRLMGVSPHFARILMALDTPRRWLPAGEDAYRRPLRYPDSAPTILVVGATGDNATTYASTQALTRQLGNARLLTREGFGHTSFASSECAANHIRAYLIDGVLPPEGTVCAEGS